MKKEASGKKGKLWLWIVIAVVLIAAIVAGIIFLPGLLGNRGNGNDGIPDLYWNVDREENTDWDTGLSIRKPAEDGNYYIRFAHNGEQVELPVADKKLVNYIDSLDLMGLVFDEDGFIIDVKPLADVASTIADSVYVQSASGDTIIANSSIAMNGRKYTIKLTEDISIYNVSGKGEFVGEAVEATFLNPMDTISIYGTLVSEDSEEEPVITHIYVMNKPVESAIYFRADQYYDSTNKATGRVPDENGAYTIKWYCNGEIVDLKCKDKDLVSYIDSASYHWCHWGLEFDEEGYIIDTVDSALGSRTLIQCERYDITEIDEDGNYTATSLIKNNGAFVQGTVAADCQIYDISSTAKAEGQVNRRVDSLQLGDRVCIWTDTMGNAVHIYITRRQADSVGYWVVTRSYDSTNKVTTRVPNANGYYEIEMLKAGDTKNTIYYTKDIEIATAIDRPTERCVGLKVGEGNIIEAVYNDEAVFGYTYLVRGYYVSDATAGICTFMHPTNPAKTKNGVLAYGAKVWNVSTYGEYGAETTLQVGDYVFAGKNSIGEVAYAYVVRRTVGGEHFYWRADARQYDSTLKVSTRVPDAEGYYVYPFVHDGKVVTLKTKDKKMADILDSQASCPAYTLEVKGDIITVLHEGLYAYGGRRISSWTVQSIDGDQFTAISSTGVERTYTIPEDCVVYNASDAYVNNKGEKTTLRVGDLIAGFFDIRSELRLIIVRVREANKMACPVDPQYDSTNAVTTRTPDKDGWYYIDLAIDGKVRTYKTKNRNVISAADSYTIPFAAQISGDELVYVAATKYVENVYGNGVIGYTVKSVSGSTIEAVYTLGHTTSQGTTESLTLASNAKIYDVTPEAKANGTFGQSVKLKAGDVIRTYRDDEERDHLYIYVLARQTREYYSYCDHCKQKVYWNPYVPSLGDVSYDTHYYLASDNMELIKQFSIYSTSRDFEIVLDLNGNSAYRVGNRVALVRYGETFTIIDSVGGGSLYSINSSVNGLLYVSANSVDGTAVLNLYGGKLFVKYDDDFTAYPYAGAVISSTGVVNMYDGTEIAGGKVVPLNSGELETPIGGNIKNSGTFNMYGGKICDGVAYGQYLDTDGTTVLTTTARGGNIYNTTGTFNMYDGIISGGVAGRGGNVYVTAGSFTMYGGQVIDGVADISFGDSKDGRGGNICSTNNVYLKGGIVSGGTVIGGNYGGNLMSTGLNDCIYISDDATVVDGYYLKTQDSEPVPSNIQLMYSNLVVSGGTVGNDADIVAIRATGTDTGGGSSVTISGGTIIGKINLSGGTKEGAKYEDYRTSLTLAGGNVPGSIDATNVKELNISGNPVVGQLTIGETLANMGAMTAGANIVVNAVGVISNPIADAAVANAIVNGNYLIPAADGMIVDLTADNELKILHPDAVSGPCEHCDGANADWIPWDGISGGNGHFVVNEDMTLEERVTVSGDMILDLNGKTVTAAEGKQAFYVTGTLNIIDSSEAKTGTLTGGQALDEASGDSYLQRGGNICVKGGTFNLYSGTISNGTAMNRGGNIYVTYNGVINVYGGKIIGGETSSKANNIYLLYSTLNVFGGEIIDNSTNGVYNIAGMSYNGQSANVNISGGKISGSAVTLEITGDGLSEIVISGGVIEGKVTAKETPSFIIEGNPVIEDLELIDTLVTFGELTEGAQIGVKAPGIFTTPFADATSAEAAAAYIVTPAGTEAAVTANNELEVKSLPAATVIKYCEHCKQNVEFTEWYGTIGETGHFFVNEDMTLADRIAVSGDMVLDLNGKTVTAAEGKQAFYVEGSLSIFDSSEAKTGTLTGGQALDSAASSYFQRGGNICIKAGTFNLYSGTISNGTAMNRGGNIYATYNGVVNIYGGKVIGGETDSKANNIYLLYSTLNVFGGEIIDNSTNGVYNIAGMSYNGQSANVNISGGKISGSAVTLEITGDGLSEIVISGGVIEGKVTAKETPSFIIEGNPVIADLSLSDTVLNVGEMTDGASIKINATSGVFTDALTNANDVVGYFDAVNSAYNVTVNADNKLEVVADTTGGEPNPTPDTAGCPHCGAEADWTPWNGEVASGHYKLTDSVELSGEITIVAGQTTVIDLAGYTMTAASGKRAFTVQGELYLIDSSDTNTGTLQGNGTYTVTKKNTGGGLIYVNGGRFELHDATVTGGKTAGSVAARGGNIYGDGDDGVIVIDNGKVTNGSYEGTNVCRGGNICVYYATLYVYGEDTEISGGNTVATAGYGGNVYVGNEAKMYIYGGTINGGTAKYGEDICGVSSKAAQYVDVYMYGGTVGEAGDTDSIRANGSESSICNFYMYGGTVYGLNDTGTYNTIALYNGIIDADPTTINSDGSSAKADCACVVDNSDGTYTIWNYKHAAGTCTVDCPYEVALSADEEDDNYAITQQTGEHTAPDGAMQCTVCEAEVALLQMLKSWMRILRSVKL